MMLIIGFSMERPWTLLLLSLQINVFLVTAGVISTTVTHFSDYRLIDADGVTVATNYLYLAPILPPLLQGRVPLELPRLAQLGCFAVILLSVVLIRGADQRAGSVPRAGAPAPCP